MLGNNIQNSHVRSSTESLQPRKLYLNKGQIFQGYIMKFFPNNLATLQIGNMNVSARLEAPLSAGQSYWFEVIQGNGIPRLRVLDDNVIRDQQPTRSEGRSTITVQQLLSQMGLALNKTNELLMRHLMAEQLPFSKDMIQQGGQLLNQVNHVNREGVQILHTLIERNLPLTADTFFAIKALNQSNTSLTNQMNGLLDELQNGVKQNPTLQSFVNGIRSVLNEANIHSSKQPILQLLTNLATNQPGELSQGSIQLLQRMGILPQNVTESQVYEQFKVAILNPKNAETVRSLWPFLQNSGTGGLRLESLDSKTMYQLFMSRLEIPGGNDGVGRMNQLLSLFQQNANADETTRQLSQIKNEFNQLNQNERTALEQLIRNSVDNERLPNEQRSSIGTQIARIISAIGYQQERELMQFFQGQNVEQLGANGEKLKNLLLHLNQMDISSSLKTKVESLLYRVTGQQLLASDQVGPLQHVAVQIPLQLGSFMSELTIQWEGKKKSNGEIDGDHCRILFYLELESLKETIVDVQIQKRIMSIQIFNEQDRPTTLIDMLFPLLKEKLADFSYQLTSLKWKKIEEASKLAKAKENVPIHSYQQQGQYQGVDFRV